MKCANGITNQNQPSVFMLGKFEANCLMHMKFDSHMLLALAEKGKEATVLYFLGRMSISFVTS